MTIRRIIPYFLTVLMFAIIYWVTMIIPNKTLFLGYVRDTKEVIDNNKIPLHLYIFNYGLTLLIIGVNLLEIISTKSDQFWVRLIKSLLAILLTYISCRFIFKQLDTKIWNMFYYYRGAPANLWCIVTMILTSVSIIFLEGFKKLYLLKFDKSLVNNLIPKWLKLERAK